MRCISAGSPSNDCLASSPENHKVPVEEFSFLIQHALDQAVSAHTDGAQSLASLTCFTDIHLIHTLITDDLSSSVLGYLNAPLQGHKEAKLRLRYIYKKRRTAHSIARMFP